MPNIPEDNVYPNDGRSFQPIGMSQNRKKEIDREKAATESELDLLQTIVDHFEQRIEFYNNIDSITSAERTDTRLFMLRVEANDMAKQNLINEKEYIEGLIEQHTR